MLSFENYMIHIIGFKTQYSTLLMLLKTLC
jgi:hypothetical protein